MIQKSYKTVLSVCGGKRETELFFYSLPVKTNHHPYWIKSGVVKISSCFGLLFYEQERLTGGVFRYMLIRFYNTFKENLFLLRLSRAVFLLSFS